MNYAQIKRRVARAERLVEGRQLQTRQHWQALKHAWREGWTPARIVAAGLVSGFISGRVEPLQALTSTRLLQMVTTVSGLLDAAQATFTTATAAAGDTGQAAPAGQTHAPDAAQPDPPPPEVHPPRPAEAATELSES